MFLVEAVNNELKTLFLLSKAFLDGLYNSFLMILLIIILTIANILHAVFLYYVKTMFISKPDIKPEQ